ncbi:unnamed protein product [Mycena citricolor]|uniref:Ribitol kinase n=2 Tax=Mycena citricolor TaxID=2018698 RepID=A0AAD2GRK6_9AGAR|nr:unnamed protein product [Mycena citricolor]
MSTQYYLGVDVGTGSARAALVSASGHLAASATVDTETYRDPTDHRIFEQSTANIWAAICRAVSECLAKSGVRQEDVRGIGFDATCSLAVTDEAGRGVCVTRGAGLGEYGERDIILWADHRAEKQAGLINETGSVVLDYVGGTMSLEMEIPKVLWLKQHMDPTRFSRCHFFDLPDFLTYRATGDRTRSACSLTCKCSFVPNAGWNDAFFRQIGLAELVDRGYAQLGAAGGPQSVLTAGMPVGKGLSKQAAQDLGLLEGTPVGSGVIDAYAGWLGTVAARVTENGSLSPPPELGDSRHRLAAVAGTSTCHLVQSPEGVFVNGVWGPYKDAAFPGWWMNEGGQSSTGQLIDFILTTHPAYAATKAKGNVFALLEEELDRLCQAEGAESITELIRGAWMYPDFHGNRSPIADPQMRGVLGGLTLDSGVSDLARKYALTLEAIALQTKHIIDVLNGREGGVKIVGGESPKPGHEIDSIYVSGGQARNSALMTLIADACGMPVVVPASEDGGDGAAVVRGAAVLGRYAAESAEQNKEAETLWRVMVEMTPPASIIAPRAAPRVKRLLDAKYSMFREMIDFQKRWRGEMEKVMRD